MRLIALTAAALLMSATAALAAPATVSIDVAPDLQKAFHKTYGEREALLLTATSRPASARPWPGPAPMTARGSSSPWST
jgi:hypothetical protein